jgi:hypothetical protein
LSLDNVIGSFLTSGSSIAALSLVNIAMGVMWYHALNSHRTSPIIGFEFVAGNKAAKGLKDYQAQSLYFFSIRIHFSHESQ